MLELLTLMLAILIVVAALQPTAERKYAGMVFAVLAAIHHALMFNVDGWLYYFTAAIADAMVIMLTIRLRPISKVIETVHTICYISILMNFIGWVMFMSYLPHHAYNASFLLIYGWAIINLMRGESTDGGTNRVGVGNNHVLPSPGESHYRHQKQ